MWRLKQLIPKDQAGLEGKTIEVGSLRLQIRSTIAQGGFSCVYLARDAQSGKSYAVKHIICNDADSMDLVKKEVSALKDMRGHPNAITLHAQSMYDMGRTKECFIVTEYCEKMMVDFLDSRGAGYFEEKQLLLIFRDICNAVYAMHAVSPPIAHRDLKAENLLLGSDGQWKLCDFGSISTNHRRFETAAEMGVEEDVIRKHTTPAYRAPEMWDLYRREIINEKVDIWALGCLLYRMAYLKSAFDGESKLQILNGNYRIPDLPKYSTVVTGLIKDMLSSSPESRPDALQVWHRVNNALPLECQKACPDKAPSASSSHESTGNMVQGNKQYPAVPSRAPPPPPQKNVQKASPSPPPKEVDHVSAPGVSKGGSFWATQYAQDAKYDNDQNSSPKVKSENVGHHPVHTSRSSPSHSGQTTPSPSKASLAVKTDSTKMERSTMKKYYGSGSGEADSSDTRFGEGNGSDHDMHNKRSLSSSVSQSVSSGDTKSDQAFIEFVADFQKMSNNVLESKGTGPESWNVELEKLRKELREAQREKLEITSKYEKLTAICRSQRTEIQDLKSALAAAQNEAIPKEPNQGSFQKPDRQPGTIWDLQNGLNSSSAEPQSWNAFSGTSSSHVYGDKSDLHSTSVNNAFGSARFDVSSTDNSKKGESSQQYKATGISGDVWGFNDNFSSLGSGFTTFKSSSQVSQNESVHNSASGNNGKGSRQSMHSTPSGWSNF